MQRPSPKALSEATGISQSYASMILSDETDPAKSRTPAMPLAITIFRRFGLKLGPIALATDDEIDVLERLQERAA